MRKPQSLQIARAKGTRAEVVNHWFKEVLTPLLKKYGLENNPDRVFNADETSFCLSGCPTKVVARKGAKSPQYTVGGSGKANFLDWFRNMFILHLPEERPVLLILDGHESHIKYDV